MGETVLLSVGTSKGLFLFTGKGRKGWRLRGPFFEGREIYHSIYDSRTGKLHAGVNSIFFGSEIASSPNLGRKWETADSSPKFPPDSGNKLERIWHIEPGPVAQPEVLYAGVAPAALFRSDDGGRSWVEIEGLSRHPTRDRWQPGAGGLCLHSIQIDPTNPRRIFIGISAVGVVGTEDSGESWTMLNAGTRAEFQPEKYPEYGQCVHKLLMSPLDSSLLFQQNHCGVYRSGDGGEKWTEITEGLPSDFGFPMALHPREPETAWVVPLQGAEFRAPPKGKLSVYRTRDGGKSWETLTKGLPQRNAYMGIYRENLSTDEMDPAGIYLGTNTGKVFFSADEGDSWKKLADNLPPVMSVEAAVL